MKKQNRKWQNCPKCGAYADMETHTGEACKTTQKENLTLKTTNEKPTEAKFELGKASERELSTILAALHNWQKQLNNKWDITITRAELDIAEEYGSKLTESEIDSLCERLNL